MTKTLKNVWLQKELWPTPQYDRNDQPHFLFIVTPPFSGSTALCKLLNSGNRTMLLHERGEGQWLVPGLCSDDRWESEMTVDVSSVKASWISRYQEIKKLVSAVDVVIEKSPPNMMRLEKLVDCFDDVSLLANNRNPYANCASILYRNFDTRSLSRDERLSTLDRLAADWLHRSRKILSLIQHFDIPLITYEQFCEDPSSVIDLLDFPDAVTESIDPHATIEVKDYGAIPVSNQNHRQISQLTAEDIRAISSRLRKERDLLHDFGYCLMDTGKREKP
ncbi:MAG: sulfotransferase family protein [Bacteroidetes bacterium]|nr:sulfotransferase family protein [Bacteroidota bacterium]